MSGRAKRSRVLAVQRHRRGNALELARVVPLYWDHGGCESLGWTSATAALLDPSRGLHFDVHAARGHARSLIEEGDHTPCRTPDCDKGRVWRHMGPSPCPDCRGLGTWRYGEVPDPRAPYLARLGQRLLDALEGQPSECQGCAGAGGGTVYVRAWGGFSTPEDEDCPDCRGSGHNLRGYLPAIEWGPQVKRKLADEMRARWTADLPTDETWGTLIHEELTDRAPCWAPTRTRVVPRDEHWNIRRKGPDDGNEADVRISKRGWYSLDGPATRDRLPAWLRGELRHAEQRRERNDRRYMAEMAEHALTARDVL